MLASVFLTQFGEERTVEKGQRRDVVLKPKMNRQSNRSLHSGIYPCVDAIKFYPCQNLSLPSRLFFL